MKKRLVALLCALGMACALLLPLAGASSSSTVYMLAMNDKLCDLLPIRINNVVYIPYTAFDRNTTGVDMGVYYGLSQEQGGILTLYSMSSLLTFYVNKGTCEDQSGTELNFRAVTRGGMIYVPAAYVCAFFDMGCSILTTPDRGTLLRISNEQATMGDQTFLNYAKLAMTTRYNDIMGSQQPSATPTPVPVATPTPTPTPSAPATDKSDVRVYLALDASLASEALTTAFSGGQRALFLFTPDSLADQSALVRKAVADGHQIGLKVEGTAEEVAEQLVLGNDTLSHIARIRTRVVSAPAALQSALEEEGWVCWNANVTGPTADIILTRLKARTYTARVELPGEASVITPVLARLRMDRYDLRQPLETEL